MRDDGMNEPIFPTLPDGYEFEVCRLYKNEYNLTQRISIVVYLQPMLSGEYKLCRTLHAWLDPSVNPNQKFPTLQEGIDWIATAVTLGLIRNTAP